MEGSHGFHSLTSVAPFAEHVPAETPHPPHLAKECRRKQGGKDEDRSPRAPNLCCTMSQVLTKYRLIYPPPLEIFPRSPRGGTVTLAQKA